MLGFVTSFVLPGPITSLEDFLAEAGRLEFVENFVRPLIVEKKCILRDLWPTRDAIGR
jgi:hypothetical protein